MERVVEAGDGFAGDGRAIGGLGAIRGPQDNRSRLVEIRGVTKSYRRGGETIEVLHGVDLDIERG